MARDPSAEGFPEVRTAKQRAVLQAYATSGQIQAACVAAGVSRGAHYHWLQTDPAYSAACVAARQMVGEVLEAEATRRALGWEEEQYRPDGTPYTVRRYSDTLLIFLLKGVFPDRYRDSARPQDRTDVSELLKAVLLELAERSQARDVTPEAEWAPVPPAERPTNGVRPGLPAPPAVEEEAD